MASIDRADWHYGGNYPPWLRSENGGTHIEIYLAWVIHRRLGSKTLEDQTLGGGLETLYQVSDTRTNSEYVPRGRPRRENGEDCRTSPVAFLEGWYVIPSARRQGAGRALVAAAEAWAPEQGCREFASDTELENTESAAAHRALGFEDAGAIRCFRKNL
jgi:GNAT superfamily N-acetyltransferase